MREPWAASSSAESCASWVPWQRKTPGRAPACGQVWLPPSGMPSFSRSLSVPSWSHSTVGCINTTYTATSSEPQSRHTQPLAPTAPAVTLVSAHRSRTGAGSGDCLRYGLAAQKLRWNTHLVPACAPCCPGADGGSPHAGFTCSKFVHAYTTTSSLTQISPILKRVGPVSCLTT